MSTAAATGFRGAGLAPSGGLTAGHLHAALLRSGERAEGSEVECMELKLHSSTARPPRPPTPLPRGFYPLICPGAEGGRSLDPTGGSGIHAIAAETYYLILARPLRSPAGAGTGVSEEEPGFFIFYILYSLSGS